MKDGLDDSLVLITTLNANGILHTLGGQTNRFNGWIASLDDAIKYLDPVPVKYRAWTDPSQVRKGEWLNFKESVATGDEFVSKVALVHAAGLFAGLFINHKSADWWLKHGKRENGFPCGEPILHGDEKGESV